MNPIFINRATNVIKVPKKWKSLLNKYLSKRESNSSWYFVDWYQFIQETKNIPEDFIEYYKEEFDWYNYCQDVSPLSESFIEKYHDRVEWEWVLLSGKYNELFLRKWIDELNFYYLLSSQDLSEAFIEELILKYEHIRVIPWKSISELQNISLKFIEKYKDNIDLKELIKNKYLPFNYRYRLMKEFNLIELENNSHFIEYTNTKKDDKTKDLIDFINKI